MPPMDRNRQPMDGALGYGVATSNANARRRTPRVHSGHGSTGSPNDDSEVSWAGLLSGGPILNRRQIGAMLLKNGTLTGLPIR
jgi:hypothetical protein